MGSAQRDQDEGKGDKDGGRGTRVRRHEPAPRAPADPDTHTHTHIIPTALLIKMEGVGRELSKIDESRKEEGREKKGGRRSKPTLAFIRPAHRWTNGTHMHMFSREYVYLDGKGTKGTTRALSPLSHTHTSHPWISADPREKEDEEKYQYHLVSPPSHHP